jgi:uncharacterized protein (DUF2062 family)
MISLGQEPDRIARSLAIGVAIGLVIPVGLQSVASVPIALFFRCNLILTLVGTLISNPVTLLPLYYIAYHIGTNLTGITISFSRIEEMVLDLNLDYFMQLGSDAIIVLITGTAVQALLYGGITYSVVHKLISLYIKRKQKRISASRVID